MADSNNLGDGKLYLKSKVGDLMQQYERSKEEEMLHKQQLKHNIMQQIINNRQKIQPPPLIHKPLTENNSQAAKTTDSYPNSEENRPSYIKPPKNNQVEVKPSINNIPLSVPRNKSDDNS
jgi:hypothetical protein